ncbi:MAG: GntR family transcriptional regulator [Nocardioidaceae bacterium]
MYILFDVVYGDPETGLEVSTTHDRPAQRRRERPQLNDEAASYVRQMIMSGRLRSGEFIRPDSLAEELGMSATPVREGLLSLRSEGFLRLEPRRGFIVAPLTARDIRDLFRAQALIAGELAARAAELVTPEDLSKLADLQRLLAEAAERGSEDEMESLNHQFHRVINVAADSPKLAWALLVATRNVPHRFYSTISGWPEASLRDHSELLSCLRSGDAPGARAATERHFDHAGELLAAHFEQSRQDA